MKTFRILFSACICLALAAETSFAQTVAVGNCRPHLTSYSTISAAVAAVTPGSTILVCPGTYPESPTITTSLTLQGLTSEAGVRTVYVLSILVRDTGPVNISNLVVGESGVTGTGVVYMGAGGTLDNLDVRSGGISALGLGISPPSNLTVVNSSTVGNIYANGTVEASSVLNLTNNWIAGGVEYDDAGGLVQGNTIGNGGIVLGGGSGPDDAPTVNENTIVGSGCAIAIGGGITTGNAVITNNHFINNSTGICPSQYVRVPMTIEGNTFVQSSVAAIDIPNCNDGVANIIKGNTFVGAPAGIVGLDRFDVLAGNNFYDVTSPTTACPDK
jgi:hypothetical protein